MPSARPTQVYTTNPLIITEKEWVAGVRVSQVRAEGSARRALELERWKSVIQRQITRRPCAVCSRDLQLIEPLGCIEAERRSNALPGVAKVPIQQQRRTKRVSAAQTDALNQAGSGSKLPAVGGVSGRVSQ